MPTAPVDDHGTVLYYEDSGAPPGLESYTTLVLVHGSGFHSASFRKMVPFAAGQGLRFIIPNLRDYPGSTPYTLEELDEMRGPGRERQEATLQARALELAAFLHSVIRSENIPPLRKDDGADAFRDGLSVLSWSAGNCQTIALFAYANILPEATRELLNKYLRSYVVYEPSAASTGGRVPVGLRRIKAIREPQMSLEDLAKAFSISASAYYSPFTFPEAIDPVPAYPPRIALHEQAGEVDPQHTPTVARMSDQELCEIMTVDVIDTHSSQNLLRGLNPEIYRDCVKRVLFDRRFLLGGTLREVWPALRVHVVWCDMSVGDCVWASVVLHYRHAEAKPEWRRRMTVHKLEGANHFVHWEEPERFVRAVAGFV